MGAPVNLRLVKVPGGMIAHSVREAITLEIEARNPEYTGLGLDPWAFVNDGGHVTRGLGNGSATHLLPLDPDEYIRFRREVGL